MDLKNIRAAILYFRSENDRNVYARLSVYRSPQMKEARLSLSVSNSETKGKPIFEATFSRQWCAQTREIWGELAVECTPGAKTVVTCTKSQWDPTTKQRKTIKAGSLTYGIDKGGAPYIGVTTPDGSFKFPLRDDPNFTYADEVNPTLACRTGIKGFLDGVKAGETLVDQALLVPADPSDNQGGFRKGGGGGNYGGGNGGGNRYGGSGNSGGNSSNNASDDDVLF